MSRNYIPELKKKIVRLHEEEVRTYKSITAEYGVSKASIASGAANYAMMWYKKVDIPFSRI